MTLVYAIDILRAGGVFAVLERSLGNAYAAYATAMYKRRDRSHYAGHSSRASVIDIRTYVRRNDDGAAFWPLSGILYFPASITL